MDSTRIGTQVNVKHCSLCQGDTEYYCYYCGQDLCIQCKMLHVIDLSTKDHIVTSYIVKKKYPLIVKSEPSRDPDSRDSRKQTKSARSRKSKQAKSTRSGNSKQVISGRSGKSVHRTHKSPIPVWPSPSEYSVNNETKRQTYSGTVYETIYYRSIMLKELRHDLKIGHKAVIKGDHSKAIKEGEVLKDLIDYVLAGDLEDRCLIQKTRMTRHMTKLLWKEQRYEQLNNAMVKKPVKFLRIMTRKNDATKNQEKLHTHNDQEKFLTQRGKKEVVNMVVRLMKGMRLVETGKRQAPKTEHLLTLMPSPLLKKSLLVKDVHECLQISDVTPNSVWISGKVNLVLTDTATSETLQNVDNSDEVGEGIHTINCEKEWIYIDKDKNINKLSNDMETTTTLIKKPDPEWIVRCVYCSPSSGDLLVGMYKFDLNSHDSDTYASTGQMLDANIGKVMRYDITSKHTKTISHNNIQSIPHNDNTPRILYRKPTYMYIIENNNGDVVVSDASRYAVVVTTHEGFHRFSYTGTPSVPAILPKPPLTNCKFWPHGICTDVLSHILLCDSYTRTVRMLDRDGQFLSYLLTKQSPGIGYIPHSLRYDVNNHVLWVGSWDENTVSVYRYINRHLGKSPYLS